MKKTTPPLVVPKPCHVQWSAMSGDEKKRFCGECGKHVYNLSAMNPKEAQAFASETQGRECVAYFRAEDGAMLSPSFFERMVMRVAGWRPIFARALLLVLPAAMASCVSKNIPTGGVPLPPGKTTIPQTADVPIPIPGTPSTHSHPVVGKAASPKE